MCYLDENVSFNRNPTPLVIDEGIARSFQSLGRISENTNILSTYERIVQTISQRLMEYLYSTIKQQKPSYPLSETFLYDNQQEKKSGFT